MIGVDNVLLGFALILVLGLFLPEIAARWKVASVPFYIIAGIIIGPFGLGFVETHEALTFLGRMGLYFLVFIAGLEVYRSTVTKWSEPIKLVVVFAIISFTAGYSFGRFMGFSQPSAILIGLILISSSVGEIIPIINASRVLKERTGHVIIPGVVILDAMSLMGLAFLTQYESTFWEFMLFAVLLGMFFGVGIIVIPRAGRWFLTWEAKRAKEGDLKFLVAMLFVIVAVSEFINLHGIVAAFFAGILLGKTLPDRKEINRIEGIDED